MSERAFEKSESSGAYAMGLANGKIVDGEDPNRSNWVRYLNHSRRRANCQSYDAWDFESGPLAAVFLEVCRDVKEGDELLFDYDVEYWNARVPWYLPKRFIIDNL